MAHLFRCAILKLLPAKKLGEHFHPTMGRPTKELYSLAGLLFIMEFRDWTHEEAADAYMFNVDLQYALNLKPENQSLCRRTLERYISLFRDDELAQEIMHDVTAELVKLLDLDVSKQMMVKVFEQQCEVVGERVAVRKHPGGEIVCNPSDPEATWDGQKGSGYQVQLSETCGADNEVQLIVSAIPETACRTDSAALAVVIEDLKASGFEPTELLADTAYGGDENHSRCLNEGIDLIAPTSGKCPDHQTDSERLTVADFKVEPGVKIGPWGREIPDPKCVACPAGLPPVRSFYDHGTEQIEILQFPVVCNACPLRDRCPTRDASGWKIVTIPLKQIRLINRRRRERTEEFQGKYRKRSGIESTNSLLKRVTGLGRLRVRGRASVFMSIYLKVAGWNVLRAATARLVIEKLTNVGQTAHFAQRIRLLDLLNAFPSIAVAA